MIILLCGLVAAGGCGASEERCDSGPPCPERSTLTGVVVGVEGEGLGNVTGFTLQRRGRRHQIRVDSKTTADFPLDHLREHLRTADPVKVEVEERGGDLYATSIGDA